jgi:hypothetical protein
MCKAHCMPKPAQQSCSTYSSSTAARAVPQRRATVQPHCHHLSKSAVPFCCSGAFKFRGAFNSVQQLSPEQAEKGVVTHRQVNTKAEKGVVTL